MCILLLALKIKTDCFSTSTRLIVTTLGRLDPMSTWLHEVTWLIKNDISPLPRGPWLPNLTRWNFIVKGHNLLSLLTLWSCNQVITWLMTTTPVRVVDSNAGLLSIASLNLLITWSHNVTWQMKNVLNSFSHDPSLSHLAERVAYD